MTYPPEELSAYNSSQSLEKIEKQLETLNETLIKFTHNMEHTMHKISKAICDAADRLEPDTPEEFTLAE